MDRCSSYRFGAGRYIQEEDILDRCGEEILGYGKKAFIIGGETALKNAWPRMEASFRTCGLQYETECYSGFPSHGKIEELKERVRETCCDTVVGVGGGRAMDLTKSVAMEMGLPLVMIPATAATCAAFTPLSVIYTGQGACEGYRHYDREVSLLLVDEQLMMTQPPRMLAAGIMDAMAKAIEIPSGKDGITLENVSVEKYCAYRMACDVCTIMRKYGLQAFRDLEKQRCSEAFHNVVFSSIALTGVVSGMMRGKKQTAIAHKIYEIMRTCYQKESGRFLHGEIVAVGLLTQLAFNGSDGQEEIIDFMKSFGMPLNFCELGLTMTDEVIENFYERIRNTNVISTLEEEERLHSVLVRNKEKAFR